VKNKTFNYEQAKAFCNGKNMELYNAKASKAIFERLVNATGYLFNSNNDQAFVRGRNQNDCNVIKSDGNMCQASCDAKLDFICEYFTSG
jgi:hypothetical protein